MKYIKGFVIGAVYLVISVFAVFFVPRDVPEKSSLQTVRVSEGSLDLVYNKSANTSYFTGKYNGGELKSITLPYSEGLKLYGTNEVFIQMKERPKYYEMLIHKDTTIFNKWYKIYELSDDKGVLIPYERSAKVVKAEKDKFFYFGIVFLGVMGFILIRTLVSKLKE